MQALTKFLLKIGDKAPATIGAVAGPAAGPWWQCAGLAALPVLMLLQEVFEDRNQTRASAEIRGRLDEALARLRRHDADLGVAAELLGRLIHDLPADELPEGPLQAFVRLFHGFLDGQFAAVREEQSALDAAVAALSEEQRQRWTALIYREFPSLRSAVGLVEADLESLLAEHLRTRQAIRRQHQETLQRFDQSAIVPPLEFALRVPDRSMRFTYRGQRTPLYGREAEMAELRSFLAPAPERHIDFGWWLWTGPGGSGKSRLAWELCLEAESMGWLVGFLDDAASFEDWHRWRITRPTLMVVDYVAKRPGKAREALAGLSSHPEHIHRPLRVLLLERPIEPQHDQWWRTFAAHDSSARLDTLRLYAHEVGDGDLSRVIRPLGPLPDPALAAIVEEILLEQTATPPPVAPQALDWLHQADPQGRPLFAMLAAEAIQEHGIEGIHRWDAPTLAGRILGREFDGWRQVCGAAEGPSRELEQHLNLLSFVTVCGHQPYEVTERLAAAGVDVPATADAINLDWWHRFLGDAPEEGEPRLGPLTPDILGELFVLSRLDPGGPLHAARNPRLGPSRQTRTILELAWAHQPEPAAFFFARAARDFPDHGYVRQLAPPLAPRAVPARHPEAAGQGPGWAEAPAEEQIRAWSTASEVLSARLGDLEAALAASDHAQGLMPTVEAIHLDHGVVIFNTKQPGGDARAAVERFNQAVAGHPDGGRLHSTAGVMLLSWGQGPGPEAEGLTALEHAVDWNHRLARHHRHRGALLAGLDQPERALVELDRAIDRNLGPVEESECLEEQSKILVRLNRDEEALEVTGRWLACDPQSARALVQTGFVLDRLKHHTEALGAFEEAIRLQPLLELAHHNRGVVLRALGRPDEALAAFREATRLDPGYFEAYIHQADLSLQLGDLAGALAACDQALELQPERSESVAFRAMVLMGLGRADEAIVEADRAVAMDPNQAAPLISRAVVLLEVGQFQEGQEVLRHVLALAEPDTQPAQLARMLLSQLEVNPERSG